MNKIERYEMFELQLTGNNPIGSHVNVDCEAEFTNGEIKVTVKGFYSGNDAYKIRFMPQETGVWKYKVQSSVVEPVYGEIECVENTGNNHGPVRVKGMHFEYADGSTYIPFGTTAYAWTHQPVELVELTKHTMSQSPFNKIWMCVFPKNMVYNHNDPELYPFAKDA
ncbi:MAG: DUF5060 domain-containing protein [Paenibacillus sp.]|nr:DUF5060 domain-containing protein [Paenibacillus sp.]